MKRIPIIAIAMFALLSISASVNAQYPGSRNMERRGDQYNRGNQYDQRNSHRRPKVDISLSFGNRGGYDRYHSRRYNRYHRYDRHNRYDRYDRYDRHRRPYRRNW